ncbi:hypothetical protein ACIQXT_29035 [Bacillus cereus]|uniref:hypothetical protein n=1 Tax=Bacillus cereus TaxID=1396 RepID=UPI00382D3D30
MKLLVLNTLSKDSVEESRGGDAWFNIAHCDNCGHVYGVFAKTTLKPSVNLGPTATFG